MKNFIANTLQFLFPFLSISVIKHKTQKEWDPYFDLDNDEFQAWVNENWPMEPIDESNNKHHEFRVGDIVKIKDEVWKRYLEKSEQWESQTILDMEKHEPQPIEFIDSIKGVKLISPHYWFEFSDIEYIEH